MKSQQTQLQKLLAGKQLREWSTEDVILWLTITNEGLFAKYIDIFQSKQINGQKLMGLDDEKSAIDLLGTQHQINTFIQCIKQLKSKNGRKTTHRRRPTRRGNSLIDGSSLYNSALFATPSIPRSSTPTSRNRHQNRNGTKSKSTKKAGRSSKRKYRSRATTSSIPSPSNTSTTSVFTYNGTGTTAQNINNRAVTPTFAASRSQGNIRTTRSRHQVSQTMSDLNLHGFDGKSATLTDLLPGSPASPTSPASPQSPGSG